MIMDTIQSFHDVLLVLGITGAIIVVGGIILMEMLSKVLEPKICFSCQEELKRELEKRK